MNLMCTFFQDLIDLLNPFGDVLSCVIERDGNEISLGTSLIRFASFET